MTAARALPALLFSLLGVCSSAAAPAPRVVCRVDGRCSVSALPAALRDPEVLDYLRSGLTTTLAVSLGARGERGEKLAAAARIDVRFEPWEEAFNVAVLVPGTAGEERRLPSEADLQAWWRDLTLSFGLAAAARGSARVSVELIPFSEEEQADARRWYAATLRAAPAGREGPAGDPGSSAIGGVLDALTLTSIKRHGVLRFSWTATVERVR
jgi:hypothetical protein